MKQKIWVFDIDGVITDPQLKKVTNPSILQIIGDRLIAGHKVAFNTGRSANWLENKILEPLRDLVFDKENSYYPLTNLISVCEMGNVVVKFTTDGESRKKILNKNTIPNTLSDTVKDFVTNIYSESMFIDETKEVILTIEMNDNYSYEDYKKRRDEFRKEISIIMKNYHPHLHVKPSSTTIAIDIKPIDSGKSLGAKRIFEWFVQLSENIQDYNFVCFGDSLSDLDMSDFFHSKNIDTEFIYVGSEDKVERHYPVVKTHKQYTKGTLEYLEKNK